MKISTLSLVFVLLCSGLAEAKTKVTQAVVGSQYIYQEAGTTNIIAPQFQRAPVASFHVTSVSSAATTATLTLRGKKPLDSYGVPLFQDQYQYDAAFQPNTYYALVTAGKARGSFFTVDTNSPASITIELTGPPLVSKDIKAVEVRPYWTLATLFPASQATVSFIPTTQSSGVMTTMIISPLVLPAGALPQKFAPSYYFDSTMNSWVDQANPSVSAGDTIVRPGQYLYALNTGTNSYPLHTYISGSVLRSQFTLEIATGSGVLTTCFSLPRASDYKLSEIGFNNANFLQSTDKSALGDNDLLLVDDGHGGVAGTYYRYKNQWYDASNDAFPTDPTFAAGTAFGVRKANFSPANGPLYNRDTRK